MLGHSFKGETMKRQLAVLAVACMALVLMAALGSAQMDKAARPSPAAKATCTLADGKSITVDYSSPRAKGRKIYGGLVPYGEVWRAGANEATTFVTTSDVMVGGTHVAAGSYTIFAIPNKEKWTLIISKKTGEWGIPYPGADQDLARVDMKASSLPAAVENFTIAFDKTSGGCTLRMDWETTRASVDIGKM
jgi:ABC-type phosphate transport system substrate-binding protein